MPCRELPSLETLGRQLAACAENLSPEASNDLPQRSGTISAHLQLQSSFDGWLAEYARAMSLCDVEPSLSELAPRVEEVVQLLEMPGRSFPRPAELARRISLSQTQLNRLFMRELGITVRCYCDQQKLTLAHALLGASRLSVKETAFRLGFLSPQHFSRWFHARSGESPSELRKNGIPMI